MMNGPQTPSNDPSPLPLPHDAATKTPSASMAKRAAFISATIFPGAGLFWLRHYVRGCVFAVPALIIVVMLFANVMQVALQLNAELRLQAEMGNFSFDIAHMSRELHRAFYQSPYWQDGKWLLLASWLFSIISSYFAGKKQDQKQL